MPHPVKTRAYRSTVRTEQAAATRRAVLTAARELFTTTGYAGTTVADIARLAGVSVDTVYTSVGRKPELLLAVHDMALGGGDEPVAAEGRDYVAAIRAADGARAKLEVYALALGERLPLGRAAGRVAAGGGASATRPAAPCWRASTRAVPRTCSGWPPSCAPPVRCART